MANINSNEISLMKGVCCKLNDEVCLTLGFFAHTEKQARDKAEYFYFGRVDKIADLEAESNNMTSGDNAIKTWSWPNMEKYNAVVYDNNNTQRAGGNWYKNKLKKIVSYEQFVKILDGWKESKKAYNTNAKYVSTDYTVSDGTKIVDLKTAKDDLIKLVGKTISHYMIKSKHQAKTAESTPKTTEVVAEAV